MNQRFHNNRRPLPVARPVTRPQPQQQDVISRVRTHLPVTLPSKDSCGEKSAMNLPSSSDYDPSQFRAWINRHTGSNGAPLGLHQASLTDIPIMAYTTGWYPPGPDGAPNIFAKP